MNSLQLVSYFLLTEFKDQVSSSPSSAQGPLRKDLCSKETEHFLLRGQFSCHGDSLCLVYTVHWLVNFSEKINTNINTHTFISQSLGA